MYGVKCLPKIYGGYNCGQVFLFTSSIIRQSAKTCATVVLFSLNPHWLYLFWVDCLPDSIQNHLDEVFEEDTGEANSMIIVSFGLCPWLRYWCHGISPTLSALLQILSRRSSRSQFWKISGPALLPCLRKDFTFFNSSMANSPSSILMPVRMVGISSIFLQYIWRVAEQVFEVGLPCMDTVQNC